MIFSGQLGEFERLEVTARVRAGARHRLSATIGGASLPVGAETSKTLGADKLGQFSVRAVDEWVVRDGIVLVLGLDYSRFTGDGRRGRFVQPAPRVVRRGDRTPARFVRGGHRPETRTSGVEMFEDAPSSSGKTRRAAWRSWTVRLLERSYRLEFGVERIPTARRASRRRFFDTVTGRGVGFLSVPANAMSEAGNRALNIANSREARAA